MTSSEPGAANPDRWVKLAALPPDAPPDRVIREAQADLTRCALELEREFDVALPFTVRATSYDEDPPSLTVTIADTVECTITWAALVRARDKGLGPVDLLASALERPWAGDASGQERPAVLDHTWRPKRVGRAVGPDEREMEQNRAIARDFDIIHEVEDTLDGGQDVMIVGQHGSGRTATAAVAARELAGRGYREIWLNLADAGDGPESIIAALMRIPRSKKYLIVVDGLQANILVVPAIQACVDRLRRHFGLEIRILATTLTSIAAKLERGELRFPAQLITVRAKDLIILMMDDEDIHGAARDRFQRMVGNDVHIAAKAIDMVADGREPTEEALQREFTGNTTDPTRRAILYRLACLGAFSQGMPENEAVTEFGDDVIQALVDADLIHRTDGAIAIAPRRRAGLVLSYARAHWPEICNGQPRNRPEEIVWTYLRTSDRRIRAALSQIDNVNIHDDTLREASLNLLATWERSEDLGRWLVRRTEDDPTWGDNLGSGVFAGMALGRLHHEVQWLKIAKWIRSRWRYDSGSLPEPVGDPTTDLEDFRQIADLMANEDASFWSKTGHPSGLAAADFDPGKAYRSWALGLLLCFEGSAPLRHRDRRRIDQLLRMAERAAEKTGGYYPARVPWVTARILIGISVAAHDPAEHPAVGPACRWLRGLVDGPARQWRGGTGEWNSDEATTAMCVIALAEADRGGRAADVIATALAWLRSEEQREKWKSPGREIALAQVVEAFVRYTDDPVREELMTLIQQTKTEWEEEPHPDYRRPEERLRLPFLAAELTEIVWRTVRREVKLLLQDVMAEADPERTPPAVEQGGRPVPREPEPVPAERPCGLAEGELRRWRTAAHRLQNALDAEIADRRGIDVPSAKALLNQYVHWQSLCETLLGRLDRRASRETLQALDDLGRAAMDVAWPATLPYPDTYCDEEPA